MSGANHPLRMRIVEKLAVSDADASARFIATLGERLGDLAPAVRDLLAGIGSGSPYLSRLIERKTKHALDVFDMSPEASLENALALARTASRADGVKAQMQALREAKSAASLAIGMAEIAGAWSTMEAAGALSDFADAAVGSALQMALEEVREKGLLVASDSGSIELGSGVAVIAMGKLGGRELNYSSDIDLIVIYDPLTDALSSGGDPRRAAVLATKLMVSRLSDQTRDGYVFRTDLRLRPDPGGSAAAVSINAAEAYYEAHGQNWERAAFIKARPIAGDMYLGAEFMKRLRPFIWRKHLDFAAVEDIHSIKRQIHAAKGGADIEFYGHDLKTGRGGIREIEFFAQTQQLILGGKDDALRAPATLDALAALAARGIISESAREELTRCYVYLRRVEHRLQMIADEQTHRLPKDEVGAARLAAFLGEASVAGLEARIIETLTTTHRHFAALFDRSRRLSLPIGTLSFTGVEVDEATRATLGALGFANPAAVAERIRRWHMGEIRATRTARARGLLTEMTPGLLAALARANDPDEAFTAFDKFLSALPGGVQIFSLLANNPAIYDRLIRIMTIAPHLGRHLARRSLFVEALLEQRWPSPLLGRAELDASLADRLAGVADFEAQLNVLRRWQAEQHFIIAAQLAEGSIEPEAAAEAFTHLAETTIAALAPLVAADAARTYGAIDGALAIVALGRLGARRMTAASDIDLMFVYRATEGAMSSGPKSLDAADYFGRLVRRFLTAMSAPTEEGALYQVDMQLRPSGRSGPPAVSFLAFQRYYSADAWTWEKMALVKARVIAGETGLCEAVDGEIADILKQPRDSATTAQDVASMRARLRQSHRSTDPWDLKHVDGGFTDIDFVIEYLALAHCPAIGSDPNTDPAVALSALQTADLLDEAHANTLITALELYETILQVGRAAAGGAFVFGRAGPALRDRLARACGVDAIEEAEEMLKRAEASVIAIFDEVVTAAAPTAPSSPSSEASTAP